jgi:hypothetical protein
MFVQVILPADMPNLATHCQQNECGLSVYRGVIVQWDEDRDDRVLDVLDNMPAKVVDQLLVVQEHEGSISFVWRHEIPNGYDDTNDIEPGDGDVWCSHKSVVNKTRQKRHAGN